MIVRPPYEERILMSLLHAQSFGAASITITLTITITIIVIISITIISITITITLSFSGLRALRGVCSSAPDARVDHAEQNNTNKFPQLYVNYL